MSSSIREALESAANEIGEVGTPEPIVTEVSATTPAETESQRTERVRDTTGKFTKDSTAQTAATAKPASASSAPSLSASVEPRKPPSSWKKEYWEQFAQLPEPVAKYIGEREEQFAQGVSTYKSEADSARELRDAIAPFMPDLQRYNIAPAQWIQNLGNAHKILATAPLPQKIARFQQLAQEYGIPIQAIQTGQIDPITQHVAPLQQQIQALTGQLNGWQQQREEQEQQQLKNEVHSFASDEKSYPHFEAVRPEMIRLLETGYADDLKSAYTAAVRLNPDIFEADQQRLTKEKAEQAEQDRKQRVQNARAKTVSTRSETSGSVMVDGGKKGLRSMLEDATESVLGGGRI